MLEDRAVYGLDLINPAKLREHQEMKFQAQLYEEAVKRQEEEERRHKQFLRDKHILNKDLPVDHFHKAQEAELEE